MPPVVAKTSGVKELFSTSLILSPYSLFIAHDAGIGLRYWNDDSFVRLGEKPLYQKMHIAAIPRSLLHECLLSHRHVCLQKVA